MTTPFIVNLAAVALSETGRTRIPLAAHGNYVWKGQKFSLTERDFGQIRENFAKRENGEVVIDYEHSQLNPVLAGGGGPVPASGWLKEIEAATDGDGILWGWCEFTDKARGMIAAGEYKFLSPVIEWGTRDKHTGAPQGATLTSVALVNRPFIEKLPAIALSEGWAREETKPMVKRVVLGEGAQVRVILDDNTEAVHAIEGLRIVALSEVTRGNDGRYDFGSLPQGKDVLIAGEVFAAMTAQQELDGAIAAGKILPAQRGFYERVALSDPAGFKSLVAGMKPQVETGERGFAGGEDLDDIAKVNRRVTEMAEQKMQGHSGMQYREAMRLVLSENPELEQRLRSSMR